MSQILSKLLATEIYRATIELEAKTATTPAELAALRTQFVTELSDAIATSVQRYLASSVTVAPGQLTVGGPTTQTTTTPGKIIAP